MSSALRDRSHRSAPEIPRCRTAFSRRELTARYACVQMSSRPPPQPPPHTLPRTLLCVCECRGLRQFCGRTNRLVEQCMIYGRRSVSEGEQEGCAPIMATGHKYVIRCVYTQMCAMGLGTLRTNAGNRIAFKLNIRVKCVVEAEGEGGPTAHSHARTHRTHTNAPVRTNTPNYIALVRWHSHCIRMIETFVHVRAYGFNCVCVRISSICTCDTRKSMHINSACTQTHTRTRITIWAPKQLST